MIILKDRQTGLSGLKILRKKVQGNGEIFLFFRLFAHNFLKYRLARQPETPRFPDRRH